MQGNATGFKRIILKNQILRENKLVNDAFQLGEFAPLGQMVFVFF